MRYKLFFGTLFPVAMALFAFGCAFPPSEVKSADQAYVSGDYEAAYRYYLKAWEKHPGEESYRLGVVKARSSLLFYYLNMARTSWQNGQGEKGKEYIRKGLELDPENSTLKTMAAKVEELEKKKLKEAETAKKETKDASLPVQRQIINLKFREGAMLSQIIRSIASTGHFNVVFENSFRDQPFAVDLSQKTWDEALKVVCAANKLFYVKLDENTVLIAQDNLMMRNLYKKEEVQTFFLSEANGKNMVNAISQMMRGKVLATHYEETNTLVVRGSPSDLKFVRSLIARLDKPREQVMVEISIMEVNKTVLRNLGFDIFQSTEAVGVTLGKDSGSTSSDSSSTTSNISSVLSLNDMKSLSSDNLFFSFPTAMLRVLERNAGTRTIASPRIAAMEGEKQSFKIGEKVAFPNSSWVPTASGGFATQAVTNYEYKDVGLNFTVTPTVHKGDEVSLQIKIEVSSLGANGYASIPSIRNREIEVNLRLKEGETNILAGLLQEDEKKTLTGIVGLSKIPLIGSLFGGEKKEVNQTDIVFTVTPHVVKRLEMTKEEEASLDVDGTESLVPEGADGPELINSGMPGGRNMPLSERGAPKSPDSEGEEKNGPKGASSLVLPESLVLREGGSYNLLLAGRFGESVTRGNILMSFDPSLVEVVNLRKDHPKSIAHFDNATGQINLAITLDPAMEGMISFGSLELKAKKKGEGYLSLAGVEFFKQDGAPLAVTPPQGVKISVQ
ncbi:MAG TPA: secretin N-terminal domain-containing protein [Candidatus Aminicenantes bacterium]|nr:secretin N-terminal domain-containing protein [Candidatus Aminicenantes bacterium]